MKDQGPMPGGEIERLQKAIDELKAAIGRSYLHRWALAACDLLVRVDSTVQRWRNRYRKDTP